MKKKEIEKLCEWCYGPILEDGDCEAGCKEYDDRWKEMTEKEREEELGMMDQYVEDMMKMRIEEMNLKERKKYIETGELPDR